MLVTYCLWHYSGLLASNTFATRSNSAPTMSTEWIFSPASSTCCQIENPKCRANILKLPCKLVLFLLFLMLALVTTLPPIPLPHTCRAYGILEKSLYITRLRTLFHYRKRLSVNLCDNQFRSFVLISDSVLFNSGIFQKHVSRMAEKSCFLGMAPCSRVILTLPCKHGRCRASGNTKSYAAVVKVGELMSGWSV